MLRGNGDAHGSDRQALRERCPKLVLCGDDGRGHSGLGHMGEDGGRLELLVARDHHRFAGTAVQIEIAGDAMHRGRRASDNGAVVRVREAWQGRTCLPCKSLPRDAREAGQFARCKPDGKIIRIETVDTDHCNGVLRHCIGAVVYYDLLWDGVVRHSVPPALFRSRHERYAGRGASDFSAAKRGQKFSARTRKREARHRSGSQTTVADARLFRGAGPPRIARNRSRGAERHRRCGCQTASCAGAMVAHAAVRERRTGAGDDVGRTAAGSGDDRGNGDDTTWAG